MRPERLSLEGFGVFREPTEIDFTGAELFALSGATGSGKSTVIDAIVFALYGSVPRYDNKNLVAPVISQGKVEARVRLDFSVGGERFRIVRIVRAGARGATTKEARLERVIGGLAPPGPAGPVGDADEPDHTDLRDQVEVLAGTADEVTAEIERRLGLTYEHFTTCVVLPQGDFQRFLHQKPSARQDLLVELLDLGVYGQMATAARARATEAQHQRSWLAQQLGDLADYTPDHRVHYEGAIALLDKLIAVVDEAVPALDQLARQAEGARASADEAAARAQVLAGLRPPDGIEALAQELNDAASAVGSTRAATASATARLAEAEAALDALPARDALERVRREYGARANEAARIDKGEQKVAAAQRDEAAADVAATAARLAHEKATAALAEARRGQRAHELAAALVVGQPCPVCLQPVHELPDHDLADLDQLAAVEREAAAAHAEAEEQVRQLTATRARFEDLLTDVRQRIAALDAMLTDQPDPKMIDARLAAIATAELAVRDRRAAYGQARSELQAAEHVLARLGDREKAERRRFDAARDGLAALGPPVAERADLAADWRDLLDWAATERPSADARASQARAEAEAADDERTRRMADLADVCREAGVEPDGRPLRDCVVERLADARADLDSLNAGIARVDELRAQDRGLAEREQVAALLGTHLKSTGFEKWVLDEVLARLVAGATGILYELSGGAYSLTFDGRANFSVIDHANADAVRSARTLSGGETFLAALALALALADEVAQLAATGAVHLESIFLDEGFGTLDPDTLDTVASAIEELGARGRLVGLVTHVHDLAERLPVRYEIRREGNASTVTRIET